MYGLSKVTKLGPPGILIGRLPILYCSFISIGFVERVKLSLEPMLLGKDVTGAVTGPAISAMVGLLSLPPPPLDDVELLLDELDEDERLVVQ